MLIIRALDDGSYYIKYSSPNEGKASFSFEGCFKRVQTDAKPLKDGLSIVVRDKK